MLLLQILLTNFIVLLFCLEYEVFDFGHQAGAAGSQVLVVGVVEGGLVFEATGLHDVDIRVGLLYILGDPEVLVPHRDGEGILPPPPRWREEQLVRLLFFCVLLRWHKLQQVRSFVVCCELVDRVAVPLEVLCLNFFLLDLERWGGVTVKIILGL